MIEHLQRMAIALRSLRPMLAILVVLGMTVTLLSLLGSPWLPAEQWLIPGVTGLLWCLTLYSLSFLFLVVPPEPDASMGWGRRVSVRLQRALLWLLGAIFLGLGLAVLVLSYQLLRISMT